MLWLTACCSTELCYSTLQGESLAGWAGCQCCACVCLCPLSGHLQYIPYFTILNKSLFGRKINVDSSKSLMSHFLHLHI